MAIQNLPKYKDVRKTLKTNGTYNKTNIKNKTHIIVHHSLTLRKLGGSNAEGYANYHVGLGWQGIGYHFVIEADGTIKHCNDINANSYHVGNHNGYCVGICLSGDFRYEEPTAEQKTSLFLLERELKKELPNYKATLGHSDLKGYEWKQCPVFDYKAVLKAEEGKTTTSKVEQPKQAINVPTSYKIVAGDTFWGLSQKYNISVETIKKLNPNVNPNRLQVGQTIYLKEQPKPVVKPQPVKQKITLPSGVYKYSTKYNANVKVIQEALNNLYFKCGTPDGYYGAKTVDAVKRFQMVHDPYNTDGIYGARTKAKMEQLLNK